MRRSYDAPGQREALARAVLEASPDVAHATLARQLDMDRETVRRVRMGLMWADLVSDLPRMDLALVTRTCVTCRLFTRAPYRLRLGDQDRCLQGRCSLGYPEAEHNHNWARSCEAYAHDPLAGEGQADG